MDISQLNLIAIVSAIIVGLIAFVDFITVKKLKKSIRITLGVIFCLLGVFAFFNVSTNKPLNSEPGSFTAPSNDTINKPVSKDNIETPKKQPSTFMQKTSESDKTIVPLNTKNETQNPNNIIKNNSIESDFSSYINDGIAKSNIAVLVVDKHNHSLNSIASEIANLYRSKGHSVSTSLFKNAFLNSPYFNEVQSGNSQAIEQLKLALHVNYIVIAAYANEFEPGDQIKWISRATLEVSIISSISKSQTDGFTIAVSNGFDDKQHAETGAIEKIILAYKTSHLNL